MTIDGDGGLPRGTRHAGAPTLRALLRCGIPAHGFLRVAFAPEPTEDDRIEEAPPSRAA
ncbi:MAG: hypothetical protein U0183_13870 [Polyangiaceae bacterium]